MAHVRESIAIGRPAAEVFALASDIAAWPEWDPAIAEAHADGPMAAGRRGVQIRTQGGRRTRFEFEILEYEPGRRYLMRAADGGTLRVRAELRVVPRDGGALVEYEGDFRPGGWLRLMAPLLGRLIGAGTRETLRALKRRCEAGAA